jgi:metal-dependent hydrolase (beta-lactamase superfamily II)
VLAPVDRVDVTVVIDNFLDLLSAGEEGVVRYQTRDFGAAEQLVAEHGLSALVSVEREGDRRTVLYDAGLTAHAVARNLDVLQVPVDDLRAIVISHGHADHHGGLEGLIRRRGRSRLPLVIHPDAWRERRIAFPSGAVNVLCHAQRLTGEPRVAGFLGGLHLTGGLFEARIEPTVDALRAARVGRILPAHCSGWRAVHAIGRAMPEAFVQCAVGTTVTFDASPG